MTIRFAFALACALLHACAGGTETGNPSVPLEIGLGLRTSEPAAVGISTGTAGTRIAEAWVAFGAPVFLDEGACNVMEDGGEPGPTLVVADLASPDARVALEVEPRSYCGMWVPVQEHTPADELPDAAPAELAAHSIVLRGERADGTPFVLAHPEQDELEVVALDTTFDVAADEPPLLLVFDVAVWMRGIDLDAAESNAAGEIRIDASENADLHAIFDTNHECSLELYRDEDADGRFDDGTDPLVARCGAL